MADKTKISIIGAAGRMGKAILSVLAESTSAGVSACIERSGSILLGVDSGLNAGLNANQVLISEDQEKGIQSADAVIDFSSPAVLDHSLDLCHRYQKPLVIGTTGISEGQKKKIVETAHQIPIVFSPNMSVGVNLLFKLTEIAASVLKDNFDVEVLDIHHKHKKDSPSGTAQKIKEVLLTGLNRSEENMIYGRQGVYPEGRKKDEIAIHTMRAGEVVGEHTVFFFSPEERIEITHKAQDRKTFAVGAVKAAEFAVKKDKGLFDMFDVLGI